MKLLKGVSLVEIILVMGLMAILLPALLTGLVASRAGQPQTQQRAAAVGLLRENVEALRVVRERNWPGFAVNGTYHLVPQSGTWYLAAGAETLGDFTRSLAIADVYRDAEGLIVTTGGNLDPSTKKINHSVSWSTPLPSSLTEESYLTRYLDNLLYTQTTQADFEAGILTGTAVTNTAGGEVILGAGGYGDWCNPELTLPSLDLPKSGIANAVTAFAGRAFAGTGNNASGESFVNISVSDTNPPQPAILGTFSNYKTNDVFGEANYGYIATDTNSKEVIIIDFSANPYTEVGFFNTPFATADATSIFVSGNRGYVTAGYFLYIFDLSSKSGSRPLLGFNLLLGLGTSVVVKGNYAYVSISNSPIEMQIIDITNPWSIFQTGYADVNGQDGKRIFVNDSSTRGYLVTGASDSKREFFVLDISSKSGARPTLGSYESGGMNPKNLSVVSGNKAIIVGTGAEEYQVLDITDETHPLRCGGLNLDVGVNGIASVLETDGDAYSYIITGDVSSEFKIIEGGPGGRYASSGTFESSIFDPGYQTAFNRVTFTTALPNQTDLNFQIAAADTVGGTCLGADYVYVGPDGTSATFYTAAAALPLSDDGNGFENPARCLRYKGYFSTQDSGSTPVLYDLSVNYSP
ncbi:hypothetical protein A3C34_00100 [Candidatus Amesbacteria bacterium RIFCSPHIGHO2_02_FULL_48_21]|uniref:LVIVD repeat protein n=2 Tax=Candidatus Amesiibacteriota TaxID=1752730 RepID=A0A0G1XL63_9BACT|nr:MAG: hypothetical protein UY22_C0001G0024 [Candidatus Amesbacteria bacterium GW2011_GWC1_48_10]KKW00720.1 MAG: hypothetical protein UY33_C0006G0004 [Candidatus Amesbacteria bacterium GW2011_GWA1_48_9]OGC95120.1 MAG: hypothetical protein A3C34_00100 [Candidatus Amesbacteria bacterium RIFCSPHIGHO2_02_FULL_48_21]OGC99893.1 MAG: hypothetical protein A2702_02675 [Candidatus Amesbacteria bacterium RIFCSPHIGHO2_01_FULL_48_75]OGD06741.1 MAG: hypothetical protein A3B58_02180 [Candidatus Amesbacteria 